MTLFFSLCCFSICLTPSLFIFRRLIVPDPLRIILFVLGGFFWLVTLLLTSLVYAAIGDHLLLVTALASIVFQEAARALYFVLMYKAQSGLAKLASDGVDVSGIRLMYSSRHILAIVCGLGMGVMAALFSLLNTVAAYSGDGVVGLPATLDENNGTDMLTAEDAYFPLRYSLGCALLTLFNVLWTVGMWDGLHRLFHKIDSNWPAAVGATILCHLLFSGLSFWLNSWPVLVLSAQLVLLIGAALYCGAAIKNTSIVGLLVGRRQQQRAQQRE